MFWAQGIENAPELVQCCYRQLCEKNPERVILLTMDNICDYVSIPNHILKKLYNKHISLTHFSDILRVSILAKRGGLWIDSTCYVTDSLPLSLFESSFYSPPAGWCMGSNELNFILFTYIRDILYKYWELNDYLMEFFLIDYVINHAKKESPYVQHSFDNLPKNNRNYSRLVTLLNAKYNEELWNEITSDTWLFKLSYKADWRREVNGEPTFYGKLLKDNGL